MDISRLHRVLKIITLLQTRRYYSVESLADELEVSRRTIYRDLNMLELAGVPFYYDRSRRGYIIHQTYWLPPINLDLEEALSLIAVAAAAGDESGVPLLGKASDAARKIESQLPLTIRAAVGQAASGLTVRRSPVARHEGLEGAYHTVREAVARRHVLRGRYISFYEKKQIDVTMEPYWLVFHERAWYVIGRCCRNDDIRTFKLGRFVELRELAETFKAPARTLEEHLGNAWRFMPEGRQYDVSLRFSRLVAPDTEGRLGGRRDPAFRCPRGRPRGNLLVGPRVRGPGGSPQAESPARSHSQGGREHPGPLSPLTARPRGADVSVHGPVSVRLLRPARTTRRCVCAARCRAATRGPTRPPGTARP